MFTHFLHPFFLSFPVCSVCMWDLCVHMRMCACLCVCEIPRSTSLVILSCLSPYLSIYLFLRWSFSEPGAPCLSELTVCELLVSSIAALLPPMLEFQTCTNVPGLLCGSRRLRTIFPSFSLKGIKLCVVVIPF